MPLLQHREAVTSQVIVLNRKAKYSTITTSQMNIVGNRGGNSVLVKMKTNLPEQDPFPWTAAKIIKINYKISLH